MKMTYGNAIYHALYDELENDSNVVLFGEDIQKNVYGYTKGLVDIYGTERVINIPLSEASVMGMACGAAMCGIRPVLDLTLPNFLYITMDQIANIAAKTHYMYDGQFKLPLTVFCSSMCGSSNAAQHSDRLHAMCMNIPGLKVICPATPQDMYSMLREAIQDDNPVICFADRSIFWQEEDVDTQIGKRIGHANIVEEGTDITIVTISSCLQLVKDILPKVHEVGINADVIDIRSVNPLDFATINKSVHKTGRLLICDTANKTGSVASEIASLTAQYALDSLSEPIQIVACENIPIPFAKNLEQQIMVTKDKILDKILNNFNCRNKYVAEKGINSHM